MINENFVTIVDGDSVQTVTVDGAGVFNLASLNDVNVVNKVNKSVLIYDEATDKFIADDANTITTITDGGSF